MNFYNIIFNCCKTVEKQMPKCFLQPVKLTPSRKEHKVFWNYDVSLRFQTYSADYKLM